MNRPPSPILSTCASSHLIAHYLTLQSRLTLNLAPGSDVLNPIGNGKVPLQTVRDQDTDTIRKKKAAEKQETAKPTCPSIRSFFPTVTPAQKQTGTIQTALDSGMPSSHSSSDDFGASQDFLSRLRDVDTIEVPDRTIKPKSDEAHDSRVVTDLSVRNMDDSSNGPATAPLDAVGHSDMSAETTADYPNLDMADALYLQVADIRIPPHAIPNRKRSLPESASPILSRKVSRESETHQSARLYNVNGLFPIRSDTSRSFDSNTSATNSFTSTSINTTTPGTSFTTETSSTSVQSPRASFGVPSVPFTGLLYRQDRRPTVDTNERGDNDGSPDRIDVEEASLGKTMDPFNPVPPMLDHAVPRTLGADEYLAKLKSSDPFGSCVHTLHSPICNC